MTSSKWIALTLTILLAFPLSTAAVPAAPAAYASGELAVSETELSSGGDPDSQASASSASTAQPETPKKPVSKYTSVKSVKLNKKTATVKNDGKVRLKASLVRYDPKKKLKSSKVTWSISNPKVASITSKGVVKGKKDGTATVTAKAPNGKRATARVTVVIDQSKMAQAVPVLTYHRIASDVAKPLLTYLPHLTVPASMFDAQLSWLKSNGYRTISTDQFREWRVNGTFLRKKSVLLTIDDGLYETYHVAYPILKRHNMKATSFVIGSYVKKTTMKYNPYDTGNHYLGRDAIRKVRLEYPNLEFQSHSYRMHYRAPSGYGIATALSRKEIDADFKKGEKLGFTSIAYPYGHTSSNLLASARASKSIKLGFGYMMTWPATRTSPRYNIPRMKVEGNGSLNDFVVLARTSR